MRTGPAPGIAGRAILGAAGDLDPRPYHVAPAATWEKDSSPGVLGTLVPRSRRWYIRDLTWLASLDVLRRVETIWKPGVYYLPIRTP